MVEKKLLSKQRKKMLDVKRDILKKHFYNNFKNVFFQNTGFFLRIYIPWYKDYIPYVIFEVQKSRQHIYPAKSNKS